VVAALADEGFDQCTESIVVNVLAFDPTGEESFLTTNVPFDTAKSNGNFAIITPHLIFIS
jgi:hypothetical protein